MRILFANNICGYYGGVEQVIFHTARGLARRGHSCFMAYATGTASDPEFREAIETVLPCTDFGVTPDGPDAMPFNAIVDRVRPDVIFHHKVSQLPPGPRSSVRTVRMVHDSDLFCPTGLGYLRHGRHACPYRAGWRCWFDLAFLARGASRYMPVKFASIPAKMREMRRNFEMDAIVAVSEFVRDKLLLNGFPGERIHVCNPVLDLPEKAPAPFANGNVILFVGALLRGKGVDLLLKSLARLRCDFRARIVGSGKSEHMLKAMAAELGLGDRVEFVGRVPHTELDRYYAEARVVAVPSRCPETFCLIGTEAMRHGRPVVAFDLGGISSWLEHEHTGFLIPEQDVDAYAAALERLLTDADLARRMGENGARRVRERFVFDRYLDTMEDLLRGPESSPDNR